MNSLPSRSSLLAIALTSLAGTAMAQSGAYEGFAYPPGTSLLGATGGSGFSTPWQSAGYGSWQCDSQSLHSLRVWQLMQGQTGSGRSSSGGLQRTLSAAIPGTTGTSVWISFIARHTGPTSSSWLGVKLPCSGAGSDPFLFIGKPFGESNWGIDNGTQGGVQRLLLPAVQKIRCVARVDFRAGRDDVTVWTNPALNAEPALADAGLRLPAYGNFADLRKVLIETGSTGGPVSNSIDELRIGSTYAEVTPVEAGFVLDGLKIKPKPGSNADIVIGGGPGGGPHVRITGNPGTPGCAGEIEMNSLGGTVTIDPGAIPSSGGAFRTKYKGWDGLIYGSHRMAASQGGQLELTSDFSGTLVTSVRTVVTDSNGTVIQDQTTPGQISSIAPGGGTSDPCPSGLSRQWIYTTVYYNPPKDLGGGNFLHYQTGWVYACPDDVANNDANTITVSGIGGSDGLGSGGLGSIEVSSTDLAALELSAPGICHREASAPSISEIVATRPIASGLGDVLVTEACDSGTLCSDPALRKLVANNIGSSGQDGVEIKWRTASPPSGGSVTLGDILETSGEAEMSLRKNYVGHVTLIKQRVRGSGGGSGAVSCDFSGVGSTEFRVTAYRNGSIVGETVLPNLGEVIVGTDQVVCGPGSQIVWGWVTELYWNPWPIQQSVRTYWGVVGCFKIGWGGLDPFPVDRVAFTPINPVLPIDDASSMAITARDISQIIVTDIAAAAPLCPADYNFDGFLDFFDYDDFVTAYETGVGPADFNGDGFVDFFDYDDFVLAYETGC